jgi:hypothetical protein
MLLAQVHSALGGKKFEQLCRGCVGKMFGQLCRKDVWTVMKERCLERYAGKMFGQL